MKEVFTSHLNEEQRHLNEELAKKRIYKDDMYEVYLVIYPGIQEDPRYKNELVTCKVIFKEEDLLVTSKFAVRRVGKDYEKFFEETVKMLSQQGKNPLTMVYEAKKWSNLPLTERDSIAFLKAGVIES